MHRLLAELLEGPCIFCKYNGPRYYEAGSHQQSCPWYQVAGIDTRYDRLAARLSRLLKGK